MKIVYLFYSFSNVGGIERVQTDRMNYMAEQWGYDVYLVTYDQGNSPCAYPLSEKVHHIDMGMPMWRMYKNGLMRRLWNKSQRSRQLRSMFNDMMKAVSPDVVVTTTGSLTAMRMIATCQYVDVKLLEAHCDRGNEFQDGMESATDYWNRIKASLRRKIRDSLVKKFHLLVTLTQGDAGLWEKDIKTVVIPNLAHLYKGDEHRRCCRKKAIFAGRFVYQKGYDDLLKIWKIVNRRHPDWFLDIYGSGGRKEEFLHSAHSFSLNVNIYESTKDIFAKYRECSFLLMTSRYEPFGLVIPEAMSCGLPVVAFDCPYGPAEIVTDGKDGFLVKDRNVEVFADRVCQLIEDEELCERMGQAAIQSAQRYSAEVIMPQWKDFFEGLLK